MVEDEPVEKHRHIFLDVVSAAPFSLPGMWDTVNQISNLQVKKKVFC